jgi:ankyrin repeat protein
MMRKGWIAATLLSVAGAVMLSALVHAASSPVADAAMQGDREAVRTLLRQGQDVNGAQGDGMTALHWAAMKGDTELVQMLRFAGANLRATTRLGAFTPLHLAARAGHAEVVAALIAAGADVNLASQNGATPLMFAASAGDPKTVTMLVENGADVNAKDRPKGETPLMYAAGYNRVDAVKLLLQSGADPSVTTKVIDLFALTAPEEENAQRTGQGTGQPAGRGGAAAPAAPAAGRGGRGAPGGGVAGVDRGFRYNELIGSQGGFAALHFAARQGYLETARALIDGGANLNQINPGDKSSPLVTAIINGHFDLAMHLIEQGADVNQASVNGVAPLYATLNMQWHNKSLYPQPKAYQQQRTSYLQLVEALLNKGANPNARLKMKVWYSAYNSDYAGVDEVGATPFWRAAYASDVEAMRLLRKHGADPNIPTARPAGRPVTDGQVREVRDVSGLAPVPVGGPGVFPLHAASGVGYGEGFAANAHRYAPTGFLPAIKYLIEELGADVNSVDHEGNTPVHLAASRGDTASVLYLVSKGADVTRRNREGNTPADMANGPVQRVQPFPETLSVLMKLGSPNSNKCVTC